MDGNNKIFQEENEISVKHLGELLAANQPEGALFAEVKNVYEFANAEELYHAANKEDAAVEDKAKWAAYSFELHQKMNAFLADINKNNPEKLDEETIANVNEAYAVNTHLCAKAIAENPEEFVQEMVNRSYEKLQKLGKYEPKGNNAEAYETELAKLLYLGKLKYEMENVHGSEEEMKNWKAEILTEMMSDAFEKNAADYKNSRMFKESCKILADNPEMEPEEAVQRTVIGIAEEKYHAVYYTFANLVNKPEDEKIVNDTVKELEQMKALADTVGILRSKKPNKVETQYNLYLDTVFIKRRANLHGSQTNLVGLFRREDIKEAKLKERIEEAVEEAKNKYLKEHQERIYKANKPLTEAQKVKETLDQVHAIDEKINIINAKIQKIATDPANQFLLKDPESNPLIPQFALITDLKNKKAELLKPVYGQHTLEYIKEIDQSYEKYIRKEKQALEKFERDLKNEMKPVLKEAEERQRALDKDLRRVEEREPQNIKEEAEQYKEALEKNDIETIKRIKERRISRDESIKRENYQIYANKCFTDSKGKFHSLYTSKSTKEALAGMDEDYLKYCQTNKLSDSLHNAIKDNLKEFAEKDKLYQAKPVRDNLFINAYKAPAVAELKLENVNVEENVTRKFEESQPVVVNNINYDNPNANVTYALECAERKANIFNGTQEYTDILNGIRDLRQLMKNNADEKTVILPLARKLSIQMDHYIERKEDEKIRKGREWTNARTRRENMIEAQDSIEKAIFSLTQKNNVSEDDYVVEDALSEIENVEKLTKTTSEEVKAIKAKLEAKDRENALELMYRFINNRVDKYYHDGKYNFRKGDYGETARYNIPSKADERMYKSVLQSFEKMLNAQLDYYRETDLEKLEVLKFNTKYIFGDMEKNIGIRQRFGIKVNSDYYVLPLDIKKADTFEDYSKQFSNHYKGLARKLRYDSLIQKVREPGKYDVTNILSVQDRHYMAEAALSNVFLENNYANREFDFKKTEAERIKFISLVKSTPLFDRINQYGLQVHDLQFKTGDQKALRKISFENLQKVKESKDYTKEVVSKAMQDEITEVFNRAVTNLGKGKEYNPNQMQEDIKTIELVCMFGKALGVSKSLEKVTKNITNEKLKGKDLEDSVKKLKEEAKEKSAKKQIKPAKQVGGF